MTTECEREPTPEDTIERLQFAAYNSAVTIEALKRELAEAQAERDAARGSLEQDVFVGRDAYEQLREVADIAPGWSDVIDRAIDRIDGLKRRVERLETPPDPEVLHAALVNFDKSIRRDEMARDRAWKVQRKGKRLGKRWSRLCDKTREARRKLMAAMGTGGADGD